MSFILDALRKSDHQRRRGAAPTLVTAQATAVAPKQPAFLFYGLLAAVLVGTGIVIGWLRPWQPEQPASPTEPLATKPLPRQIASAPLPALPEIARKSAQAPLLEKSTSAAPPAPVPTSAAMTQEVPAFAKTETQIVPPKAVTAVPKVTARSMPEQPAGTGLTDAVPDQRVMTMAELPAAIQQEIPRMSISVHAYSVKPKDRMVSINNQLLREGGNLAPGLTLEQITPGGMIFTYKGYRFHRALQGSGATAETQ